MAGIVVLLLAGSAAAADGTPRGAGDLIGRVMAAMAVPAAAVLWWKDLVRPGSFARNGRRDVSAWPWWFWAACGFVVLFAHSAGLAMGGAVAGVQAGKDLTLAQQGIASLLGGLAGAAAGLILLRMIQRRTADGLHRAGLGFRADGKGIGQGLIGIALAFPIVLVVGLFGQWLSWQVRHVEPDAISHETLRTLQEHTQNGWAWVLAGCAVVLAPITEEILFRLFVQSTLLGLVGRTWPAILVTAAFFALIHLGGGVKLENAHTLLGLFTLGAGMGIAYERTRNIVVPIVMHATFNAVNVALTVWGG